jgi:ankyrin repeat protein
VFCQLEMLRLCLRSNVRHFLNELPDTLDKTYERILKDIHKTNRSYAHRLLQCVALAIRPLQVEELALLLTLDPVAIEGEVPTLDTDWGSDDQEQEMLSACPSLITIVGRPFSRVVQFSHFSVKEFLTSDRLAAPREDISHYHILPDVAHTTLARASLGVSLSLKDLRNLRLLSYPVHYWVDHALVGKVSASVMHMMETLFDSDKPHFAAWLRAYTIENSSYPHWCTGALKPLYFAALWGFYDLVKYLVMKHPQDINFIHHDGGYYPLVAALEKGHMQIAELLLQHGANVDMRGVDFRGWREWQEQTPLHKAIGWSNDSMATAVKFLLKHGADVNARQKDLSTPLHLATARGCFDVAQMLLKHGADVNTQQNNLSTPLHLAAARGDFDVAQMLLKHGADVNTQQNNLSTPLHLAAARGDFDVAQMLLQCGADVNSENSSSNTPLQLVSFRPNLVRLLLEHGAEVNSGQLTALHRASHSLDPETVRLLVKHGANVNVQDGDGYTPLYHVLQFHNKDEDRFGIAQLLIERGADVNTTQGRWGGHTLLCSASRSLDLESVQFLLRHGADVNATNLPECRWYCSPVHAVLLPEGEYKHLFKVAHLVRCGADVNTEEQSRHTVTPLHSLQLKLLRILLDHGANIRGEDREGQTLFHRVFELGHFCQDIFDLIQLLVDHGVDVNTTHKNHGTLLHLASYRVDLKSVRFLLGLGTNVNVEVEHWKGRTPLHQLLGSRDCSVGGRFSIAQLLVERGANLYVRDQDDRTPLHLACHIPAKELNLVRFFLDHGANVNAEDKQGQTPLHRVLEYRQYTHKEYFSVAQLLVDRGADVNARDKNNETALHFASHLSDPKLVQMLLIQGANVNSEDNKGRTPLHRLSESWNGSDEDRLDTAQLLVVHGANVNARDESEETPLHLASAFPSRKLILVRFFLDNGVNANVEDKLGRKPLHQVAGSYSYRDDDASHFDIAQLLMERDADVNAQDKSHVTPLHLASYQLKPKLVLLFLNRGANANAVDNQGWTPLHRVSAIHSFSGSDKVRFDTAQLLIAQGADVNARDTSRATPLHLISIFTDLHLVRLFLDHGANINAEDDQGRTPLYRVLQDRNYSYKDRFTAAQLLIEHGADVNVQDKSCVSPLHLASQFLKTELVQLFLDHGANPNAEDARGWTPLHLVVLESNGGSEEDRFEAAQLLIARGADVNARSKNNLTPLHLASYRRLKLKLVRLFLDHGANANSEDTNGSTPLHKLVERNSGSEEDCVNTAQLLIARGADVNARSKNNRTPLHRASYRLKFELVRFLLDHGANANAEDAQGNTPLHQVLEKEDYGDKDTVGTITQLLLDHGADANTPNDNHETPLHLASRHLSLPVAWILLKHGADQTVTNKGGKTPFQLLRETIRERPRFLYDFRERRTDVVALMGLLYDC